MRTFAGAGLFKLTATLWLLWLSACEESRATVDASTATEALTATSAWTFLSTEADPLATERPTTIACGIEGWGPENGKLEIATARCNYLSVGQPALTNANVGSRIVGRISHYDLTFPEPAIAHAALLVGGKLLWERTVTIPGPADVIDVDALVTSAFPAGVPVVFHLHNHGQNNWQVAPLSVIK
jgi:hypothetical protein